MKLVCSFAFVVATAVALGAQTRATVFEHARVIDGTGRVITEDSSLYVVDGQFADAVKTKDIDHVDLRGKTIMPAMVEAHAHLGYRTGTTFTADNFTRDVIHEQLQKFAAWGVSGVLSTGTDVGDLIFQLRAETGAPSYAGTIIRTAWRGIAPPDAGPFPPMRAAPFGVRTEEEARADVRTLAEKKADFVKIWVDDRNGTLPKLSPAVYRAIIDEAHKHNLRVIAHVVTQADVKDLLRAGIDGFAHMFRDHDADAELLSLLKARPKVFFMLTLWAPRLAATASAPAWLDDPLLRRTATAEQIQQFRFGFANRTVQSVAPAVEEWKHLQYNVATLGKAGVKIVLGTDVGGNTGGPLFGWTEHMELENMVAAGMTPAAAISAATKGSAEALRLDQLGTIAKGKRADFIVLDANPLDNIANSRRISRVYQRGLEVSRPADERSPDRH
jgi:imidazolonepropionase-like amidohydrolase